ncbi:MAG: mucoidy inhibitor MuiA family protein [Chloroflexi bacterium]|nr:mucoidy inhibitor MuiA family protein [Chloroflexota bacterium]
MTTPLTSHISAVTVFPDRARVVRKGTAVLDQTGPQQLLFDNLPLTLDRESVRVAGQGTARVRIRSVDVAHRFYEQTPAERVREIEEAIQVGQDELATLEGELAILNTHAKHTAGLWEATAAYAAGLSRGRSTVEQQGELVAFLLEQDEAIKTRQREIEQAKRPITRRLQKLLQELKQWQSARPQQRNQATVEIEVLSEGEFTAELTYMVNQAGWHPLYDVRLQPSDEPAVELTYIAQITQSSGENWEDVKLTVSTARPALNQRLPDLHPHYLDVYVPRPQMVRSMAAPAPAPAIRAKMAAPEVEEFAANAAPMMEMAVAEIATAEVSSTGTAVTFEVGGSADIPSDGSPHKTTIAQFRFKPNLDYIAIPQHTDSVYRRVKLTNDSPSPLLAGQTNLFVQEEYIGQTAVAYTPTAGELELLFGVEERLTVGRELTKREVDKKFLSDKRRLRYGYEIKLESWLDQPAIIEVRDNIPVSRHEEIKVELKDVSPAPAAQSDLNMLKWLIPLPAKQKRQVRYEYQVEHNRNLNVTGLLD